MTIGMPLYNGSDFVAAALDALLAQTYEPLEIVISDNASTDDSEAICRSYLARDPRIRYERSPLNRGLAWNFRQVMDMARGTYFMYAPHDDLFGPGYVASCVAALEADPGASYAFATSVLIDGDGARIGVEAVRQRYADAAPDVRCWDVLVVQGGLNYYGVARRDVFRGIGRYPALPRGERIITAGLALAGRFVLLPPGDYLRRVHAGQITAVRHDRRAELAVVDPGRRGWRAAVPIVLAEYALGYVAVAMRAPLRPTQRVRVLARIGRWLLGHVPGLAVRDPRASGVVIERDGPGVLPDGRTGIGY